MRRYLLALALLALSFVPAHAVDCYWRGGTGNWDNSNTASWANASGGTASTCAATGGIPKQVGDFAIFDAASGGGTVTVCGTSTANCPSGSGAVTLYGINCNAFASGNLNFSTRNPNVTLSHSDAFRCTGTATRTLSLGNGTWTLTGNSEPWSIADTTNLTFNANSSTLDFQGTGPQIETGALTYNTITFSGAKGTTPLLFYATGATITTLNITNGAEINVYGNFTLTNAPTWTGTAANPIVLKTHIWYANQTITVTGGAPAITWAAFNQITFATTAMTATNSFDLGGNVGITITPPSTGGGSACVGC